MIQSLKRSIQIFKPWLAATLLPLLLAGCQVSGGGRTDSNTALAYGSIAVIIILFVLLLVQRSRFMRLMEDEVKKTEAKVREEADRRVEAARAEAAKESKTAVEEARKAARADVAGQIKAAKEEAQLEAVKLVREAKATAKAELEIKLNEVRDQAVAETERRVQEIEARTRQEFEQKLKQAEQQARQDASRQQQRSRDDAERRLQEARRRAAQARSQRVSQQKPAPRPPAQTPRPPAQAPQRQPQRTPPVQEQKAPRPAPAAMPWSTGPTSLDLPGDGISILLAEDSATMRKVFEMTLAGENCKLVTAESGDQAVDLAKKLKPDLVIADLSLDGTDGYAVCEQVMGDPSTSSARVILLHGSASALDERKAQQAGAQGEITKPFTTAELLSKIQSLF